MSSSQRAFPRVPVHLAVLYRSADDLREATIESLSRGGVFIRTRAPLPIGTPITIEISLADQDDPPVTLRGRVAWTRGGVGTNADLEGMGVEFLDPLPPSLRKILTQGGA
jgi:type IV pilus assembly protein PilZ